MLFVIDLSSGFTNFAYIFYLWKCGCNLSIYSMHIGYVNMYNILYNLSAEGGIKLVVNNIIIN